MKFIGNSLLEFVSDFTVIDMETTGRSNQYIDITEMSVVRYRNGKPVKTMSTLVKARNSILPFVADLTGITNKMIENAPLVEDVIEPFVDFIGSDIILGHNVEFDYTLIFEAFHVKTGLKMTNNYIDTLRISRLMNKDVKNHKLETLCSHFEVNRDVAHRGLEDSIQTAEVYLKMYQKYQQLQNRHQFKEGFYERIRLGQNNL